MGFFRCNLLVIREVERKWRGVGVFGVGYGPGTFLTDCAWTTPEIDLAELDIHSLCAEGR